MTKQKTRESGFPTKVDKIILTISSVILVVTIPVTFIMFFLPLLGLPVAALAMLVVFGKIRNFSVVRLIEVFSVTGAGFALWLFFVLLNWFLSTT